MGKLKVIIVGVSDYKQVEGAQDLPFCRVDVRNFKKAVQEGLGAQEEDITLLGLLDNGRVNTDDFVTQIQTFSAKLNQDDTAIFYFSGHGDGSEGDPHYLVLSDDFIQTQIVLELIGESRAKNKVVFLDCCFSGNFELQERAPIKVEDAISAFSGTGYAILSSSNAQETSAGGSQGSVFTNILCSALTNNILSKKGFVSLYDIQFWVKRALEVYTNQNPKSPQHSIFKASVGGTVFFKTSNYVPYLIEPYYYETQNFIIHSVIPMHNISSKRYAVKITPRSIPHEQELADQILKVIDRLKYIEIYNSDRLKHLHLGKSANIFFVYVALSEKDLEHSNFYAIATWTDKQQDREWWYRIKGSTDNVIKDVHIQINQDYNMIKNFIDDNTMEDLIFIETLKNIRSKMINKAQEIMSLFIEYSNNNITEEELFFEATPLSVQLDELYLMSTDLGLPSSTIKAYAEKNMLLLGTIHDFSYVYNESYRERRDKDNRKTFMNIVISRYNEDLEELAKEEKLLFNSGI